MILSPLSNRNPKFTSPKVTFFIFVGIVFHNLNSCYIYFHGTVGSAGASVSSFWIFWDRSVDTFWRKHEVKFNNRFREGLNVQPLQDKSCSQTMNIEPVMETDMRKHCIVIRITMQQERK